MCTEFYNVYILLCSRLWVHLPYFLHGESATTVPSTTRPQWVASFSEVFSQHYAGLYAVSVNSVSVFILFQSTLFQWALTISVFMLFQSTLRQSLCCFSQLCVSLYVVSVNSMSGFMLFRSALCQSLCCFSQLCHLLCCFSQLCVSLLCCFSQLWQCELYVGSVNSVSGFMLWWYLCGLFCSFANVVLVIWNQVTLCFAAKRPPLGTDLSKGGGTVYEGFVRVRTICVSSCMWFVVSNSTAFHQQS